SAPAVSAAQAGGPQERRRAREFRTVSQGQCSPDSCFVERALSYAAERKRTTDGGGIMALGRRNEQRQGEFWVATQQLPSSPGHVFYEKLNELLAEGGFDEWVEELCTRCYAKRGRPSVP